MSSCKIWTASQWRCATNEIIMPCINSPVMHAPGCSLYNILSKAFKASDGLTKTHWFRYLSGNSPHFLLSFSSPIQDQTEIPKHALLIWSEIRFFCLKSFKINQHKIVYLWTDSILDYSVACFSMCIKTLGWRRGEEKGKHSLGQGHLGWEEGVEINKQLKKGPWQNLIIRKMQNLLHFNPSQKVAEWSTSPRALDLCPLSKVMGHNVPSSLKPSQHTSGQPLTGLCCQYWRGHTEPHH